MRARLSADDRVGAVKLIGINRAVSLFLEATLPHCDDASTLDQLLNS